ncbi:MAG: PEP-CTERM sorting domain-containing protein [Gammaproteobacteria bacterium]
MQVPEPSTWAVLALGAALIVITRKFLARTARSRQAGGPRHSKGQT